MLPRTLRNRLLMALTILVVIPLAITMTVTLSISRRALLEHGIMELQTNLEFWASKVDGWIDQGEEAVQLATHIEEVRKFPTLSDLSSGSGEGQPSLEEASIELQNIVTALAYVRSISVLHPVTGRVTLSTDAALKGRIRSDEDYFQEGLKGTFVSPVIYSVGRESPVLITSGPVVSNGELVAVMSAEMELSDLQRVFKDRNGLWPSRKAYLVDAYGFDITVPGGKSGSPMRTIYENDGVKQVLKRQAGHSTYLDNDGNMVLGAYRWLDEVDLGLIVEIDYASLILPIRQVRVIVILTGVFIVALSVASAIIISRRLVNPVQRIAEAAKVLREGDYTQRVQVEGSDEVQQLALAFNAMTDSVERSREDLERRIGERTKELTQANKMLKNEVAERIQAEEAMRRNTELASVGRMASGIAHEINNPLATISACVEVLAPLLEEKFSGEPLPDKIREYLGLMGEEIHHASGIIHQLLDFTRTNPDDVSSVGIENLVRSAVKVFKVGKRYEKHVFKLSSDQEIPPILAEKERLRQVVVNLLSNACDSMPDGGEISISCESHIESRKVVISVSDNGFGINEDIREKIFSPFFTTKLEEKGTGLGLFISHSIVNKHGGEIIFDSKEGSGTTFTVILPVQPPFAEEI